MPLIIKFLIAICLFHVLRLQRHLLASELGQEITLALRLYHESGILFVDEPNDCVGLHMSPSPKHNIITTYFIAGRTCVVRPRRRPCFARRSPGVSQGRQCPVGPGCYCWKGKANSIINAFVIFSLNRMVASIQAKVKDYARNVWSRL
jgi:hypothetical protein